MKPCPMPAVRRKPLCVAILSSIVAVGSAGVLSADSPANPSALPNPFLLAAGCNPCNPCATKTCNPCNPCNPCSGAKVNPCKVKRPAGSALRISDAPEVIAEGERLWNDTSISTNGLACQSCHTNNMALNATFAEAYPHRVAMPYERAGFDVVDVDEMVQFCMVVPMQAEPFAWDSNELMALSSYTRSLQAGFNPSAVKASPSNPCNPCAVKNPCNPCAVKNPCNPCAAEQ